MPRFDRTNHHQGITLLFTISSEKYFRMEDENEKNIIALVNLIAFHFVLRWHHNLSYELVLFIIF